MIKELIYTNIRYIQENKFLGGISQPCPAVVTYIEKYLPELLPNLFPVQSPLMFQGYYFSKPLPAEEAIRFVPNLRL